MNIISNLILLELLCTLHQEVNDAAYHLYEMVCEDRSEAAAFGDGPCGSMLREEKLADLECDLAAIGQWINNVKNPFPEPKVVAPFDPNECPF